MLKAIRSWTKDPQAESILSKAKVLFRTDVLELSKINWESSKTNCGRHGGMSVELLEDYKESMKNGAVFPMPVLYKIHGARKSKEFGILSGAHRSTTSRGLNDKTISAYVIDQDLLPAELRTLSVQLNGVEGRREEKEERVSLAISLVEKHGITQKEASRKLDISLPLLNKRLAARKIRVKVTKCGIRGSVIEKLPDAILQKLSRVTSNKKVLKAAVDHCSRFGLVSEEVAILVRNTTEGQTEAEQLAKIQEATNQKSIEETPQGPVVLQLRTKFIRSLHALIGIVGSKKSIRSLQIKKNSDEFKQLKKEWSNLKDSLDNVFK